VAWDSPQFALGGLDARKKQQKKDCFIPARRSKAYHPRQAVTQRGKALPSVMGW
jgi:hypothetical protein